MNGTLWGLGVGPGDPDLLTLKAARVLERLAVVAYPAPLEGDGLARTIAGGHVPADAIEIVLRMPFDPKARADDVYDAGAAEIAGHLAEGRDVGVLCEGDPLFFGSFLYLLARLGGRFPVEIVPGVSSLSAVAAVARHAVTARDDALVVIPATRPAEDIEALLAGADAAAIMKIGRHLPKVWHVLQRAGLADKAVYVERATQAGERIRPLASAVADAKTAPAPYFAMILVHKRGQAWK